jgi:uncharacterized protein (UPF0332 family)
MPPRQFLVFAQQLLRNGDYRHPAAFRSIVSRAYYAAFLHVREFLTSNGAYFGKGAVVHERVCKLLSAIGDALLGEVGAELGNLRTDRNAADYDLSNPQFDKEANATNRVEVAADIIQTIEDCRADQSKRSELAREIRRASDHFQFQ